MDIWPGHAGLLVWVLWGTIGVFEALVAQKCLGGRRMILLDIVVAVCAALLGGYGSVCCLGVPPLQMFLISVLAAVFFAGVALWIAGAILLHFSRRNQ